MAKKRKKVLEVQVQATEVVVPTTLKLGVSTRDQERPKGSIRIVPGRKDAK